MENNRVVLINNIPSPYSVDLYRTLQQNHPEYEFHIIFTSASEGNRNWKGEVSSLNHVSILESKVIRLKTRTDQRYIHFPASIQKKLEEIDPIAVIAKEYNPSALSSLAWCRKRKRKFIHVTEGTLLTEKNLNFIQKYSRKKIITKADFCIAASTKAKEKLEFWKCPKEKIAISFLTFDMHALRKAERKPIPGRLLYVGSFAKRKGVDLLISSLPYIKQPYHLHLVGNGSEEELSEMKQLAETLGVRESVEFCGYKEGEALFREYGESSVFVLATREDCFGLVLLEAAALGVPIVSSKYADGAYDIIIDGVNGMIADPYDSASFGKAIASVLSEPSFQEAMAHADLSAFDIDEAAKVYVRVLNQLKERG
ncbi:MAG: glycosyltransferase family 4 protein [Solobacterium sp.]|nr:glycosyltransferase family 4 protein [Solobacterium sp.]